MGSRGKGKRLEAITLNFNNTTGYQGEIEYRVHRQTYGWTNWMKSTMQAGTVGQAKRLEGITITVDNPKYSGGIRYKTHVQVWLDELAENGELSGTYGRCKRLEAIQIELTGEMKNHYDIYYRVHAQSFGWLGWAKNGESSGTAGYAKRLEAIQILLVPKGEVPLPIIILGINANKKTGVYFKVIK